MAYRPKSISASWRAQSLSTKLLRAWLGLTWIYAGWYKASDSSFLTKGGANYIGVQLAGFAQNSPLKDLLLKAQDHAVAIGWITLLGEFTVGIATIAFITPRLAALLGFGMSIGLWLSATYNVHPYFYGSDSAYAVMWFSYFLIINNGLKGTRGARIDMNRRSVLRIGSLFGVTGGFIGLGQLFPRTSSAQAASGKKIIALSKVPVGGSYKFKSSSGAPAMLFRTKAGVFAYSLICTHQGCTVDYSATSKSLQCPCHGSAFDPFNGAKVLNGPAQRALPKISVKISGKNIIEI